MPRRHHLLLSESQHWLRAPSRSPASSRPSSPLSPSRSDSISRVRHFHRHHTTSITSVLEQDAVKKTKDREVDTTRHNEGVDEGPAKRWVKWMQGNRMRNQMPVCIILVTLFVKWCVGLSSYSGAFNPPYRLLGIFIVILQVLVSLQCLVITKHSGTGWKLQITCLSDNGILMTCNIGVWTTLR